MKRFLLGTGFGLVLAFQPPALAADCSSVLKELEGLRQAQHALLTSLADNHETFAATLEETSSEFESYPGRLPPRALRSMNQTAQAFRARGTKAKNQTEKLDAATAELISEVTACLRTKR